jgi:hypothetical protein
MCDPECEDCDWEIRITHTQFDNSPEKLFTKLCLKCFSNSDPDEGFNPLMIQCPVCGAKPHENCYSAASRRYLSGFHLARAQGLI